MDQSISFQYSISELLIYQKMWLGNFSIGDKTDYFYWKEDAQVKKNHLGADQTTKLGKSITSLEHPKSVSKKMSINEKNDDIYRNYEF